MKLRRKLLSAGLALGASALTLTTSTFAWYTQNSTATVNTISGATEAGTDTNLFVARAETYDSNYVAATFSSYLPTVAPVRSLTSSSDNSLGSLKPVSYKGTVESVAKNYVKMTSVTTAAAEGALNTPVYSAPDESDIYSFTLRFKGTVNKSLYFSEFNLAFTSTADSRMTPINYAGDGITKTGINSSAAYWAHLAKALKLDITTTVLSEDNTATDGSGYKRSTTASETVLKHYDLASFAPADSDVNITGANAVGYYNSVFNTALSTTYTSNGCVIAGASDDALKATAISAGTSGASNALVFANTGASGCVEVKFTFWLDGWDEYCYDVMRSQSFTFNFVATTNDNAAVVHTIA